MQVHYRLCNDWLEVELAAPSDYLLSRFDRTGIITQVKLREEGHTFCTAERPEGLCAGGAGLCNEFGLDQAIGYEETPAGGLFPKLGVGLLTRTTVGDYDFEVPYPVDPFDIDIAMVGNEEIRYTVGPKEAGGYAARLTKSIRVEGTGIRIRYRLDNVGPKPLSTSEYVHNFISINGFGPSPDMTLRFSSSLAVTQMEECYTPQILEIRGTHVHWLAQPTQAFYCQLTGGAGQVPASWELIHRPSGAGMRETCRFPVERMALWGTPHVVSPEMFIALRLAPGQRAEWTREYSFFSSSRGM